MTKLETIEELDKLEAELLVAEAEYRNAEARSNAAWGSEYRADQKLKDIELRIAELKGDLYD